MLAASAGQVVSIDQSASRAARDRSSDARNRLRWPGRTAIASRPRNARIASPRIRPEHAQHWHEEVVEDELPREHARIRRVLSENCRRLRGVLDRLTGVVLQSSQGSQSLVINLVGRGSRQIVQKGERVRNHVSRQMAMQCRFMAMIDFFWSGLSATNAAIEMPTSSDLGYHTGAIDSVVAVKRRLDLTELDAIAALLDHPVASAVELKAPGAVIANQIAGAIPTGAALHEECGGSQLRLAEVAVHHARARDHQLAERARGKSWPCSSTTRAESGGQTEPIGNAAVRSGGIVAGIRNPVQTLVSVGP